MTGFASKFLELVFGHGVSIGIMPTNGKGVISLDSLGWAVTLESSPGHSS